MTKEIKIESTGVMECLQCGHSIFNIYCPCDNVAFPYQCLCCNCHAIMELGDTPYTAVRNSLLYYYSHTTLAGGDSLDKMADAAAQFFALQFGI